MSQRRRFVAFLVFVSLLVVGCDSLGGKVGPCDVQWKSPLVEITKVEAESSNRSISKILLTDFVVRGDSVSLQYSGLDEGTNIKVEGDTLLCAVPCSFGREQGSYAFTVAAPGYESKRLNLGEVKYANRKEEGPCPRIIYSGSQNVSIRLTQVQETP